MFSDAITGLETAQSHDSAEKEIVEKYLNIIDVIIVALDIEARITFLNRKGHRVLGYEEGELIGKDWIHTCLRPQNCRRVHDINRKIIAGQIEAFEYYESYVLTKKGEERFIAWHTTTLKTENGRISGTFSSGEDITDRKQAEDALRRSEQEKTAILDGLKNASVEYLDPYMNIIWINNAVQNHLGFSGNEIKGMRCFKVIQGLESPCSGCTALKALQTAQPQEGELITPDGKAWISHANPIKDANGKVAGVVHVAVNISDRKKAEKALQESENLYRTLFENTGTATAIIDDDTIISLANSIFEKFLGYRKEEVEGKSWTEFVVKEDLERMMQQHKLRRMDPNAARDNYEFRAIDKNGQVRYVLLRASVIPGTKNSAVSLVDITERKLMEEALRKSREQYRLLAESSQDMIYVIGRNDKVEYVNGSAARALGLQPEEIIGVPRSSLFTHDVSNHQKLLLDEVFETGLSAHTEGFMILKGMETWQDTLLVPLKTDDNETHAVLGISRDITERKRAEEELKRTQSKLRIAMDLAKLVQWEYDVETDLFTFDDQFYALYRTTAEREGGPLMSSRDYARKFLPPEEAPLVAKEISKASATTDPNFTSYVEHRIIRGDGTEGFIAVRHGVVKDDKGHTIKTYGANQDITERKRAEEALRDSESKLASIIDFLPDATLVIDSEGKVIAWNRAIEEMTGIKAQDILGRGDYEYSLPFYGQRRPILVDLALEPQSEIEKKYSDFGQADGILVGYAFTPNLRGVGAYLWGVASPIYDIQGRIVGAIESIKDITEQKRMEGALQESKDYLDKIINAIGDPLFVIDRQHRAVLVNDAACKIISHPREQILGKTISGIFPSKEMADISWKNSEEVFNTGAEVTNEEAFAYADNTLTVLVKKTPYTDNAGNQFLVGVIRDITDRKQAEDRIIASLHEKEVLLKEVHHRVKNNLQIISALLSLQSSYLTDEDIIKIFRDSQNRIKSMALVHENLYRSKDLDKVDFNEYINQLASYLSQSYGDLVGKIKFKVNSENVYLNINTAIPCGMIINELVSNTLKHAFPDGRSGEVCVDLSSEDGGFMLVVSDNGAGIKGDINIKESKTLGFRLIDTLVRQIDGKMSFDTSNGTRCEIHFKRLR